MSAPARPRSQYDEWEDEFRSRPQTGAASEFDAWTREWEDTQPPKYNFGKQVQEALEAGKPDPLQPKPTTVRRTSPRSPLVEPPAARPDVSRVQQTPYVPPEAPPTMSAQRLTQGAARELEKRNPATQLLERQAVRERAISGIESTLPGKMLGGENVLSAVEGFAQTGSLPIRLAARAAGVETTAAPAEAAAELRANFPQAERELPFAGVTRKLFGVGTTRELSEFAGALPALAGPFSAARAVVRPGVRAATGAFADAVQPAIGATGRRVIGGLAEEAGTVGLAMGGLAAGETLAAGGSPGEALTSAIPSALHGAALGTVFGAVPAAGVVVRDAAKRRFTAATERARAMETARLEAAPVVPPPVRPGERAAPVEPVVATPPPEIPVSVETLRPEPVVTPPVEVPAPASVTPPPIEKKAPPPVEPSIPAETRAMPDPYPPERPAGRETTIRFGSEAKEPARYRVIEAEDLQPSHDPFRFTPNPRYPAEIQGRDYLRDPAAQAHVKRVSLELDESVLLDPGFGAETGPPTVTPRGIVVAGSGRAGGLRRAMEENPTGYQRYRRDLEQRAAEFGVTSEQIAGMARPVLVREIAERDVAGLAALNRASDQAQGKTKRAIDDAAERAGRLSKSSTALDHFARTIEGEETVKAYLDSSRGREFVQHLVQDKVFAPQELARYVVEGRLTEEGKIALNRTMLVAAVERPAVIDAAPPNIVQRIENAVPHVVRSASNTAWDLRKTLTEALDIIGQAETQNLTLQDFLDQGTLLEAKTFSGSGKRLAKFLTAKGRTKAQVTEAFRTYAQAAVEAQRRVGAVDLFPGTVPTREGAEGVFASPGKAGSPGGRRPPASPAAEAARALRRVTQRAPEDLKDAARVERNPEAEANQPGKVGTKIRKLLGLKPLSPAEVWQVESLKRIGDQFSKAVRGFDIRQGRLRGRESRGEYTPDVGDVRVKRGDWLDTVAHEIGHYLSERYLGNPTRKRAGAQALERVKLSAAARKELNDAGKRLYGSKKPTGGYGEEGVAEWSRYAVIDPTHNTTQMPEFSKVMEGLLTKEPALRRHFKVARAKFEAYEKAPAIARIDAMIAPDPKTAILPRFDQVITQLFNDIYGLTDAVNQMGPVSPLGAADVLARVARGQAGHAFNAVRFGVFQWGTGKRTAPAVAPLLRKIPMDQRRLFEDYLVARTAGDRLALGRDPGMKLADVEATINALESTPGFKAAAEAIWKNYHALLDLRVDVGLLTQVEATKIRVAHPHYMRRRNVLDPEKTGVNPDVGSRGGAKETSGLMRDRGSPYEFVGPIESFVRTVSETYRDVAEHRAATALVKQAARSPGGAEWAVRVPIAKAKESMALTPREVAKLLEELGLDEMAGQVRDMPRAEEIPEDAVAMAVQWRQRDAGRKEARDLVVPIRTKSGGIDWWQVKNREMYELLRNLSPESNKELGALMSFMAKTTGTLKTGVTLSLEFMMRNLARDAVTTAIRSYAPVWEPVRFGALTVKLPRVPGTSTVEGLVHYLFRNHETRSKVFHDFQQSGAEFSQQFGVDRRQLERAQREMFDTGWAKAVDVLRHPLDYAQAALQLSELSRLGEFAAVQRHLRRAGAKGKMERQLFGRDAKESDTPYTEVEAKLMAALAGRHTSTDFAIAGVKARAFNRITEFFNPAVQGIKDYTVDHIRRPGVVIPRAIAYLTLPSLALWAVQRDDPAYQELPEWRKALFWNIVMRGADQGEGWDQHGTGKVVRVVSIPKNFEWGITYGTILGERIPEWITSKHDAAMPGRLARDLKRAFVPPWIPTLARIPYELGANRQLAFDRPIVPKGLDRYPAASQYRPQTGELARQVGEVAGVSPLKVEYAVTGVAGGLGGYALQVGDVAVRTLRQMRGAAAYEVQAKPAQGIPGLKAFVARAPGFDADVVQRFYARYQAAEKHYNEWLAQQRSPTGDPNAYYDQHQEAIDFRLGAAGNYEVLQTFQRLARDDAKHRDEYAQQAIKLARDAMGETR